MKEKTDEEIDDLKQAKSHIHESLKKVLGDKGIERVIKEAHQEAHECYAKIEVHDNIDLLGKKFHEDTTKK